MVLDAVVDDSAVWVVEIDEIWLVLPGKVEVVSIVDALVVGTGSWVRTDVRLIDFSQVIVVALPDRLGPAFC